NFRDDRVGRFRGCDQAVPGVPSTSMPLSLSVGTPGIRVERRPSEIAKILTCPDATCGVTEIAGRQAICTSLRSTAVIAWGERGWGPGTMVGPFLSGSASMARCDGEPLPIEP